MAESPVSAPAEAAGERMSYEEFLEQYEGERAEWVDGRVYPMSPVGREHQRVGLFLATVLNLYVSRHELGELFYESFQMRLGKAGREPDLAFVSSEHLDQVRDAFIDGPADLVIEIVSPDSKSRDRGDKYFEYEQGGVPEYWIVDPERRAAEFYRLDDGGVYRAVPLDGGVFESAALEGFRLRVDWLWERPPLREALAELGLR